MPRVRPIGPEQAKRSFLQRFAPALDRVRQVATNLGLRSHRVFLVWTLWDGQQRGEGDESEVARMELLPTPKVEGFDALQLQSFSAGVLPVGTIRVSLVSVRYTEDQLRGRIIPPDVPYSAPCVPSVFMDPLPANLSFFYEVVEDGRGDALPVRQKYRLSDQVWRREGKVSYSFLLERISEDSTREGPSRFAPGGAYG
jgi:hypothetical protein